MIRLQRPSAPSSLKTAAKHGHGLLWSSWAANNTLEVKNSIYGSVVVKQRLATKQKKCAYCETVFVRDHIHVEHYRPHGGWKQNRSDPLIKPGYFWLAYTWKNFLLSCSMCNDQGHKANLFPLENPSARGTFLNPVIHQELPLLLNPFDDDPEAHITWNKDIPTVKGASRRGSTTIEVFKLDTDTALIDNRRLQLRDVKLALDAVERNCLTRKLRKRYLKKLRASIHNNSPYAGMIRANFGSRIRALVD